LNALTPRAIFELPRREAEAVVCRPRSHFRTTAADLGRERMFGASPGLEGADRPSLPAGRKLTASDECWKSGEWASERMLPVRRPERSGSRWVTRALREHRPAGESSPGPAGDGVAAPPPTAAFVAGARGCVPVMRTGRSSAVVPRRRPHAPRADVLPRRAWSRRQDRPRRGGPWWSRGPRGRVPAARWASWPAASIPGGAGMSPQSRTAVASISTRCSATSSAATPSRVAGGTGVTPSFVAAREIPSSSRGILSGVQSTT
jgi:hypothetical protein